MLTFYKTEHYTPKITEVNVKGETEKFVILVSGRKDAKKSQYTSYHKTREAAIQFRFDQINEEVRRAQDSLNYYTSKLKEFTDLNKII